MLQFIRERAQGLIAWVIVILIIIPFALWGINQYFRGGAEQPVAKVNGNGIPQRDFHLAYQQVRAFRQSLMGQNFNPALMDENEIKQDALKRLIRREVLAQAAIEAGFRIGDEQLGQDITKQEQFQNQGKFDPQLYERLVNSRGMTTARFESSLRVDLLSTQILSSYTDTAIVTDDELDNILRIKEQQRKIGYMILKSEDYTGDVTISDDEISDYYENHLDRFAVPEQVSIEYLELSAATMAQTIQVDDKTLHDLYEEQQANFSTGEERHARHILINVKENADDKTVQAARSKAEDILKKIRAGEDFAKLAKKYSDDSGSAAKGGDLGFFGKGVMVKPFEDTVFSMKVNEVSDLVRSPFGFHIIKLEGIKAGHTKSFDEVRATLEQQYKEHKAEEQFFDQADRLADLTYENPDTLSIASQQLNIPIVTTGLFSRNNGQGIATDPKIREAAFSADVLDANNNSEPIDLGQNRLVVLRIKEHKIATTRPQEEVKDQVIKQLQREKARQAAEEAGKKLLQRINAGENAELIADEARLEWNKTGFVGRNNKTVTPNILSNAFKLPKPEKSKPVTEGFLLPSGDYAIVSVYEVKDGDPKAVEAATRESLKTSTLRNNSQQLGDIVYDDLKQQANITTFPDRL